jgi:hypothetical protein
MADTPSLADLEGSLRMAETRFYEASEKSRCAQREETAALNALNDAQKAFDVAVNNVRLAASGGDWKTERDRRHWTKGATAE